MKRKSEEFRKERWRRFPLASHPMSVFAVKDALLAWNLPSYKHLIMTAIACSSAVWVLQGCGCLNPAECDNAWPHLVGGVKKSRGEIMMKMPALALRI